MKNMMDLWMQIEGTKLIFITNFSVLDFFKFASRMPQIAQILVSTSRFSEEGVGGMPPDSVRNFLFFSRLCFTKMFSVHVRKALRALHVVQCRAAWLASLSVMQNGKS